MNKISNNTKNLTYCKNDSVLRKFLPFIPIIGIPLTIIFHQVYKDTGIENNYVNWASSILQAISIIILVYYV